MADINKNTYKVYEDVKNFSSKDELIKSIEALAKEKNYTEFFADHTMTMFELERLYNKILSM